MLETVNVFRGLAPDTPTTAYTVNSKEKGILQRLILRGNGTFNLRVIPAAAEPNDEQYILKDYAVNTHIFLDLKVAITEGDRVQWSGTGAGVIANLSAVRTDR